jgi:RNA polymerase sigma-70 factor (ECF subfamily)
VSDKQRQILHLRVVVGLSVEEPAEAVGSTPSAARVAQRSTGNSLFTERTADG